jgi:xanthine dehydrogenase accessory factor
VYDVARSVLACVRGGTRVDVAWLVDTVGFEHPRRGDALVVTPGGGRIGSVLPGAVDVLLESAASDHGPGRLVSLPAGAGTARCLVVPATELPDELWPLLVARSPVAVVTALDGDRAGPSTVETPGTAPRLFEGGVSSTTLTESEVVTVLVATPRLMTVGGGPVLDALVTMAGLLGWTARAAADESELAELGPSDRVVVAEHDLDIAGPALAAALSGEAGYVGALGSRAMREARAEWLADRGISDLTRLHSPAGLSIGAQSPVEIAVAIVAEILALR